MFLCSSSTTFIDALHTDFPTADRADRLALYGWLVGSWSVFPRRQPVGCLPPITQRQKSRLRMAGGTANTTAAPTPAQVALSPLSPSLPQLRWVIEHTN
jgi:hypothetical protein